MESTDVFPAGMNGIALYRIPGIVATTKGTVLAYCEARKNARSDWGEIEVHLRRSTDDGKTWNAPQHIAHDGSRIEGNPNKKNGGEREQTVNNPVAIVDRETGAIEFLYCINYARCYSMRSTFQFRMDYHCGRVKRENRWACCPPAGNGSRQQAESRTHMG